MGEENLLPKVHRLAARSLQLHPEFFNEIFMQGSGNDYVFKLSYMPPTNTVAYPRYESHRDWQAFTLLAVPEDGCGLQVMTENGWEDVKAKTGSILVIAGDLWPIWTNNRWRALTHRVESAKECITKERLAFVYFTGPDKDTMISCVTGDECEVENMTAGENFMKHLRKAQSSNLLKV